MKTKTLKISLATAKEWYKGDNNTLKELALQVFDKNELQPITCVKSWSELCERYPKISCEYYINTESQIKLCEDLFRTSETDKNLLATKEDTEAFLALMQLKRLRDQWWEVLNWKPDYTDYNDKHAIVVNKNEISITTTITYHRFLTFSTEEIAEDFLNCFKDLIEKAKDLI